ncbi:MAG: hypothetical protein QXZ09_10310 [Candidatus Methanomethylicaceae archaeon]
MKTYPFLINRDASGERLRPVGEKRPTYNEVWLQDLLCKYPDILPTAEIEPVFHPLIPIGREVITEAGGAIDNLFISHRGYLVLVETKLWRNPEAKREVVAQAIDYGACVSKWNYSRLNDVVRAYTRRYEGSELDLLDWVERECGPVEGGRHFFEETVAKNLRLGRFLILIVGDRIRQSLVDMLDYVNRYPHLATNVALVELRCYQWRQNQTWPLLVIPGIVAHTEVIERSVIQVTVQSDGTYWVDVRQERAEDGTGARKRVTLTEEAFWELLKEQAPAQYMTARSLVDRYRGRDSITIDPRESSVVVKLDIQDTGQQVSLFFINKSGRIQVWPKTIASQLVNAGLDPGPVDLYDAQMRNILRVSKDRKNLARSIANVDIDEFVAAVDAFIERVQVAQPAQE